MNGWKFQNGKWLYYKAAQPVKGWYHFGAAEGEKPHWSYFDKNTGALYTGWHKMGTVEGEKISHWSYFGKNGWLRTGWVWLTSKEDGEPTDHWSYFGANGWLRTGWVQFGKGTVEPDGDSAKHWSFFGNNGWLRKGLIRLGKDDGESKEHLSFFDNSGWLVCNKEISVDGKKYKADNAGWLTLLTGASAPITVPSNGMTYSRFIQLCIGRGIDYDGAYSVQCVDLAKYYLDKVFGIKPGAWGNAHAYYDNYHDHPELVKHFDRIPNSANFVPKKGDIVIWKKALNGLYGHIAIATGVGNTEWFESWDQNWTGRNDPTTKIRHSYRQFAGVLRPKDQSKCA